MVRISRRFGVTVTSRALQLTGIATTQNLQVGRDTPEHSSFLELLRAKGPSSLAQHVPQARTDIVQRTKVQSADIVSALVRRMLIAIDSPVV